MKTIPNSFAKTLRDVLEGNPLNQKELAQALGISAPHLSEMKYGKRSCSAEYDLRLSRYFGTSEGFWLRLQTAYQLRVAKAKKGASIEKEVRPLASV